MSHLTDAEVEALNASDMDRSSPFVITSVSSGYFSIARHYGGVTFNKKYYLYIPTTDELVRDDVVKWLAKHRKNQKKGVKS